jgi:hypothetical protein
MIRAGAAPAINTSIVILIESPSPAWIQARCLRDFLKHPIAEAALVPPPSNTNGEIFRELDTKEFDGNAQLTFLSSYRTLCRELFAKSGHLKTFDFGKELDRGRSPQEQRLIQEAMSAGNLGATTALAELNQLKDRFDKALLGEAWNEFSVRNFRFDVSADLGRGLIRAEPNPNGSELYEGKVVCGEFVIPGSDAPALLNPVEEAFHQITSPVQIRTKTNWVSTIALRRNVGPRTVFTGECSDPVRIVSSISKQHRA